MTELVQKASVRATIAQMGVGETIGLACDIVSSNTVRGYAVTLGVELQRKYTVHLNRANRTFEVTRHE